MQGTGTVAELSLLDGLTAARLVCPPGLIPSPGQYVLAHAGGVEPPLAAWLFAAESFSDGFLAASPVPASWRPGVQLHLRGPLGHGFSLPPSVRRLALIAFKCSSAILLSLLRPALTQEAAVTLVAERIPEDLPLDVEVQPMSSLLDVCRWADYLALDLPREQLPDVRATFGGLRLVVKAEGQVLVRTPMPCGALAACGVCTVQMGRDALLACDDGPVFDFHRAMEWSSRA